MMRRQGLRARLRHQRRLIHRLVARHVLARRQQPVAQFLESLGAWFQDEPRTGARFVPPLLETDAAAIAPTGEFRAAARDADVELEESSDDASAAAGSRYVDDDAPDLDDVAPPSRQIVDARVPERRVDIERPAARDQTAPNVAAKPKPAIEPPAARTGKPASRNTVEHVRGPVRSADDASARSRPASDAGEATRVPRPAPRIAEPSSRATPPATSSRSETRDRPTQPRRPDAARRETERDIPVDRAGETAREIDRYEEPNVRQTTRAVDDAALEPQRSVADSSATAEPTGGEHKPSVPAQRPVESPVERTAHDEIVSRALGALRASGEIRTPRGSAGAGTPRAAEPAASPPTSRQTSPPTQPTAQPEAPRSTRAPTPAPQRAGDAQPATPSEAGQPGIADDAGPEDRITPEVAATEPIDAEPNVASAASATPDEGRGGVDAPIADVDRAAASRADQPPDKPETSAAPRVEAGRPSDAVDASVPRTRVDEQRQARRPAHLDRARTATPPTGPSAPPAPTYTTAPPKQDAGQFQFANTERTTKDWGRLLFEATSPPRPGAPRARPAASPPTDRGAPPAPSASRAEPATRPEPTGARPQASARNPGQPRAPTRPPSRARASDAGAAPAPSAPTRSRAPNDLRRPTGTDARPRTASAPRSAEPAHPGDEARTEASDTPSPDDETEPAERQTRDEPSGRSTPPEVVAEALRALPSEPVAPSMRRFLRPLVGVDPDSVRIHRGERAAAIADQHDAKAIAVGDDVALGAGHDERDPETIALVAHELTHAARARDRRFVPPIARAPGTPTGASTPTVDVSRAHPGSASSPPLDDEEAVARTVEARVRSAAARERQRDVTVSPNADARSEPRVDVDDASLDGEMDETLTADDFRPRGPATRPHDAARRGPWGALPAPWEPLPASIVPGGAPNGSVGSPPTHYAPAPGPSASSSADSSASAPTVQRAERGGSAGEEPPSAGGPPQESAAGPDMDALARQVYDVLKRRLAAERRRGA